MNRTTSRPAAWRRPCGVAQGTWAYTNERSIADRYDAFVADTPLCQTDLSILQTYFPPVDELANQKIIDLGCGSGRTALELAARGYRVLGVDLSQAMLEVLQHKRLASAQGGRIWAVRANLVELEGIVPDSFNHAVCMFSTLGMIQGRQHRRRMLAHVARLVSPGGRFVLHVHHRWSALREPRGFLRLARSRWRAWLSREQEFGDATYAYRGIEDMFMHRFSRRELQADLAWAGWSVQAWHCLSTDGSRVIAPPLVWRHHVGGWIVSAIHRRAPSP